jgi:Na+-transporting NADH:ubiquinone oxidoreductase subunit NqrD
VKLIRLKYTKWFNISKDGLFFKNQIAIAVLGICSSLAVSNRVENAIAMGLGVTFVVMASSATISLLRKLIPPKVRMVTYMVVISAFVIAVQMFLQAYFPVIAKALGAYVGLIITNCIVMGRAEAFGVIVGTETNGVAAIQPATTNIAIYVMREFYAGSSNLVGTITVDGLVAERKSASNLTNDTVRGSGDWFPTAGERWFILPTDTLYLIGPTQATVRIHGIAR